MRSTDKLKQSLYFPDDLLREIMREAVRLDRSLSWTVQQAWRVARAEVRSLPPAGRGPGADPSPPASPSRREPADTGRRGADADRVQPSAQVREFLRGKFDHESTS